MKGREKLTLTGSIPVSASLARRELWLIPLFTLLTAVGAMMRIYLPGTPVPATLQTFFVLIAGGIGGVVVGTASQVLYLTLGLCGVPFFAGAFNGSFLSPTIGYLIGFICAAAFMGYGKSRDAGIWMWMIKGLAATGIIYASGILFLTIFSGGEIGAAFSMGVLPFLPWDITKILFAAFVISSVKRPEY